jgi:hypothetical protein
MVSPKNLEPFKRHILRELRKGVLFNFLAYKGPIGEIEAQCHAKVS